MRVLFAASEIFPYAKTGGLADVAYALPKALGRYCDMMRVMPLYGSMGTEGFECYDTFTVTLGERDYSVRILERKDEGIKTYFVEAPVLSETAHPYGDASGDYADNALRFGIFCMSVVALALRLNVRLLHLNDWHSAMAALYIKQHNLQIRTLFTIHNLAYQGIFEEQVLELLGVDRRYFTMDMLEFYGKVNFLKAGIGLSDIVTTVSQTYAREILTPAYGCGLDGFLKVHEKKLFGILNGIDYSVYPPLASLSQKRKCKKTLLAMYGLTETSRPLFVFVSRLVEQKGVDLLIDTLPAMLQERSTLFFIGEGEKQYREKLHALSETHAHFHFFEGYDETLSRMAYCAADFLLMPSRFEPCGLNQFIAMNSGAVPVVHWVGGLKESVHETQKKCGRGIGYSTQHAKEFLYAFHRACELYEDTKRLREIQTFNLACDFSFDASAKKYAVLYEELV